MRSRFTPAAALAAALLIAALLSGCSGGAWAEPRPIPEPLGALGEGFEPSVPPSPEATINPAPGSWDDVRPAAGLRVVLLTTGDDEPTLTTASAVRDWARETDADLRTVAADENLIDGIVAAMDLNPDLIITAGNDLIDPLATVTASHLDRQFLVIGAEVGEPTHNVTAVDWDGASFRGEGNGAASVYDPESFTPERTAAAVRAGVAAVLNDLTGIVLWIE